MSDQMQIEVLYFDECSTYVKAVEMVREVLSDANIDAHVELIKVEDENRARHLRFVGSPTIRVDGRDIDDQAEGNSDYGLRCRLYMGNDRMSGLPPREMIEAALVQP